jgi:hypothetical protein
MAHCLPLVTIPDTGLGAAGGAELAGGGGGPPVSDTTMMLVVVLHQVEVEVGSVLVTIS